MKKRWATILSYALFLTALMFVTSAVAHVVVGWLLRVLNLSPTRAIVATYGAELVARLTATGITLWKVSQVLADSHKPFQVHLVLKERSVLFALALFSSMFAALDSRVFWWVHFLTNMTRLGDIANLNAERALFITLLINLISLSLLNFKTWRSGAFATAALMGLTALGFAGALMVDNLV